MAKTIFILGAGASYPYGFPLGQELVTSIIKSSSYKVDSIGRVNATPDYLGGLLASGFLKSDIDNFRHYLRESNPNSIDAYLSENKHFLQIGKSCIAYILLKHESNFGYIAARGGDWYNYLGNILTTADPDNFDLKIYSFNYDRSLEYFLKNKAQSFFYNNMEKQKKFLEKIPIIHLHGSLGDISLFGKDVTIDHFSILNRVASNIKIISEVESDKNFEDLQLDIKMAKNVIFLGFGFHPLNMKRIGLATLRLLGKQPKFFASSIGLEEMEINTNFRNYITELFTYNRESYLSKDHIHWLNAENLMFLRKMIDTRDYFI